ncbi:hypothetical protein KR084_004971, partial [Drosophila pseudotakahashii]
QINLHHSKAASPAILLRLAEGGADVVLVQAREYKLMLDPKEGKIRTILAKRHHNIFLLRNYSNGDNTVVSLALQHSSIRLLSAYMAYEKEDPPDALVKRLAKECEELKTGLIPEKVWCDNATNFVGADRHMRQFRARLEEQGGGIATFASRKGCELAFIPPKAPHFGGLWEAGVKFWQRWSREYVSSLQAKNKWHQEVPNVDVGALVVVAEENLPPQQWMVGRILA